MPEYKDAASSPINTSISQRRSTFSTQPNQVRYVSSATSPIRLQPKSSAMSTGQYYGQAPSGVVNYLPQTDELCEYPHHRSQFCVPGESTSSSANFQYLSGNSDEMGMYPEYYATDRQRPSSQSYHSLPLNIPPPPSSSTTGACLQDNHNFSEIIESSPPKVSNTQLRYRKNAPSSARRASNIFNSIRQSRHSLSAHNPSHKVNSNHPNGSNQNPFKVNTPKIRDVNKIDRWSRIIFPVSYMVFNAFYWSFYTLWVITAAVSFIVLVVCLPLLFFSLLNISCVPMFILIWIHQSSSLVHIQSWNWINDHWTIKWFDYRWLRIKDKCKCFV